MFLLRSVFWLTVAFFVIRPDVDLPGAAGVLSAKAVAAGQQAIVQQLVSGDCASLECVGGNALLAAATSTLQTPSNDDIDPMQESSSPVPFPRPRPDWMG